MFSAAAVPAMLEMAREEEEEQQSPVMQPINMGPAASAAEAWEKIYGSPELLDVEPMEMPAKIPKSYECNYCDFASEYQYNRNRHEALVHGIPKPPAVAKPKEQEGKKRKASGEAPSGLKKARKTPSPKKPPIEEEEKKQPKPAEERKPVTGEVSIPVKKEEKKQQEKPGEARKAVVLPVKKEGKKQKPAEDMKCIVVDGGKQVFYANDIIVHICH